MSKFSSLFSKVTWNTCSNKVAIFIFKVFPKFMNNHLNNLLYYELEVTYHFYLMGEKASEIKNKTQVEPIFKI